MKSSNIVILFLFQAMIGHCQDGYIAGKPALAYWKVGNRLETVIVLHGGPGITHNYLRPEWDELSRVATVIYYDQRGGGRSEKTDCYSWKEHVNDLKRVISAVSKDNKVVLAGSSWGSMLAMLYAYSFPEDVKAIILSGTIIYWKGKGQKLKECSYYSDTLNLKKYRPIGSDSMRTSKIWEEQIVQTHRFSFHKQKKIRKEKIINISPVEPEINVGLWTSMNTAPTLEMLKEMKLPVLIFKGAAQRTYQDGADIFTSTFANSELFTIKEADHDPWLSNPGIFFQTCKSFIKKQK